MPHKARYRIVEDRDGLAGRMLARGLLLEDVAKLLYMLHYEGMTSALIEED